MMMIYRVCALNITETITAGSTTRVAEPQNECGKLSKKLKNHTLL